MVEGSDFVANVEKYQETNIMESIGNSSIGNSSIGMYLKYSTCVISWSRCPVHRVGEGVGVGEISHRHRLGDTAIRTGRRGRGGGESPLHESEEQRGRGGLW